MMRACLFCNYRAFLLPLAVCLSFVMSAVPPVDVAAGSTIQTQSPSIQITKKRCEDLDVFPVFVESHCLDVPNATFTLTDPREIHGETLTSGEAHTPGGEQFTASNLWTLDDTSRDETTPGVRVVSCLAFEPGSNWHSSVLNVIHPEDQSTILLDWMFVSTGIPGEAYQPSLDCIWFELPNLLAMPAVLNLQVFTAETPYLNWTEPTGPELEDLARGESGEDLEAEMVMTNVDTGDVYSFAADAYGQVLVPSGTYSLVESANGNEVFFTMLIGQTTLVEVGLAAPAAAQGAPAVAPETRTFPTGAHYCDNVSCTPAVGVTIYYESSDGAVQGSCVTEPVETPWGEGAWCDYEFLPGVPTILTLDESTLPAGWALASENPLTYLVPENPDGPLSPVYFQLAPN